MAKWLLLLHFENGGDCGDEKETGLRDEKMIRVITYLFEQENKHRIHREEGSAAAKFHQASHEGNDPRLGLLLLPLFLSSVVSATLFGSVIKETRTSIGPFNHAFNPLQG